MSEDRMVIEGSAGVVEDRDRKFTVSTNRGKASHRVRYVETGGAGIDSEECILCESVPDLSDTADTENR